ncbi:M-phase phosphoprotein 8 [Apophysomyces sp. BC1015]|nr:M-phase phosphoprotein 8 [Apophysomyces sp. BC1015]
MFARHPNGFQDYREVKRKSESPRVLDRIKEMENVVFPAIREHTKRVQEAEQAQFNKTHRIITDIPTGKTKGGSYILEDNTGALLPRNIPPSHLKLLSDGIDMSGENVFEVQSVIDHKGSDGNYEYRVRWKGYAEKDDTWEPPEHFDDQSLIDKYWQRRGTKAKRRQPQQSQPKNSHKRQRRL